ncbi:MAG: AI-2E family transporter, partial [Pseudorhodoplanes sp.]
MTREPHRVGGIVPGRTVGAGRFGWDKIVIGARNARVRRTDVPDEAGSSPTIAAGPATSSGSGAIARGFRVGAIDPAPFEDAATFWRIAAQLATILMAAIMFGAFLYLARPLLVPLLSALIVALTIGPLTGYAVRHGLPAWIPALVIVVFFAGILYLAIVLLADPVSDLIARSGEIATS